MGNASVCVCIVAELWRAVGTWVEEAIIDILAKQKTTIAEKILPRFPIYIL